MHLLYNCWYYLAERENTTVSKIPRQISDTTPDIDNEKENTYY